jgi:hypothetical protein
MSFNDSLLFAPMMAGLKRLTRHVPNWTTEITNAFYLRVNACQAAFPTMCALIPSELGFTPALQTNMADFLFNRERNQLVLNEYFAHFLA